MSPLRRRTSRSARSRPAKAPDWATPLDDAQFAQFSQQLRDALAPHGGYALGEGFVTVPGRATKYGLTNLLQQWALSEPDSRAELVALHFHNLFEAEDVAPLRLRELERADEPPQFGGIVVRDGGFDAFANSLTLGELPPHPAE